MKTLTLLLFAVPFAAVVVAALACAIIVVTVVYILKGCWQQIQSVYRLCADGMDRSEVKEMNRKSNYYVTCSGRIIPMRKKEKA